jgi:hypothetical protein
MLVEHRRIRVVPPGSTSWMPVRHEALCGRPCLGAGVNGRDYKAGLVHRGWPCEACEEACYRVELARGHTATVDVLLDVPARPGKRGLPTVSRSSEVRGWYVNSYDGPARFEILVMLDIAPELFRGAQVTVGRQPGDRFVFAGQVDELRAQTDGAGSVMLRGLVCELPIPF